MQKYKPNKNTVFNDHLQNVNSSIACIQDNYSEVIYNTININSGSTYI